MLETEERRSQAMKKTMAGLIALIILAGALSAGVIKGT